MTTYPNDQGQAAGATPAYLVTGPGGTAYTAGSPPPFSQTGQATITAGTSSSNVALGSADASMLVINNGSVTAYVKPGGPSVTAAVTDTPVPPGTAVPLATGTATYLAAITGSSTAALVVLTGTGSPAIYLVASSGGGGGGGAVTIADGADVAQGAVADAAVSNPASSGSLVALNKGQFTLTGALTEAAPATDTASSGLNGRLQRIAQRLTSLIALLPGSLGAKAAASSLAITIATDDVTLPLYGAVNETAPATDTASSGQNGRLQRIAQRVTSLIALFPSSLGAKTGAGSLSVVPASDATFLSVPGASTTGTLSNVAASATSVTLLASNSGRRSAYIYNDSAVSLYMKYGSTASTTSFTYLIPPNAGWQVDDTYTGIITGIWPSATGNARVTEVTA